MFKNEELRLYGLIILVVAFLIATTMYDFSSPMSFTNIEKVFRDSLFTVVSLMTTTGFATIDYMALKPVVWLMLLIVMVIGASASSTAGGMKVVRVVIILKYAYYEFKKIIHPNAVFPVKYNGIVLRDEVITRVLAFVMLYIIIIAFGCVVLSFTGMGFLESIGGMITCISDVGPGFGINGPTSNFSGIPGFSKWFLSFVMLIGRLEVFTVLVIFTPIFWKK
ncbi:Trk system potassium uptake protein TrkI [bioreactor metagenome]|uniref:Trk system potassium uptake protein TrkI n=1 Tax=bioreactor metagenome TaxID=1076179 RepID=A0A645CIH5_9ZZZZ